MKVRPTWWFAALLVVACGDDSAGSGPGSTSGATATTTSGFATSTSTTAGSTATSGTGGSGFASTGPAPLSIAGDVVDLTFGGGISGVSVFVLGNPAVIEQSGAQGVFTLAPAIPDTDDFLIAAEIRSHWGAVLPVSIRQTDVTGVRAEMISQAFIDAQVMTLQNQNPNLVLNDVEGIILARANTVDVTVDITPGQIPGEFYAPSATSSPTLDANVTAWSILPVVVFFNLPVSGAGEIVVSASHPTAACEVANPSPPVLARHVSLVEIVCR